MSHSGGSTSRSLRLAATLVAALALPAAMSDGAEGFEKVVLKTGNTLEGNVIKRTQRDLFLDVGYSVIRVPLDEIEAVKPAAAPVAGPPGEGGTPAAPAAPVQPSDAADSIFLTGKLSPGSIEEKARDVGEGVLHVLGLTKSGSGFVVNDKEGYVVTNFHVIERERDISVVIYVRDANGFNKVKKDRVRIVALNPYFDLALLKIEDLDGVKLRAVYLGDYEDVRVGDPVFAIGNPLGLERTVSEGIVSSRNRVFSGILSVQTTAAINPGNSGGPLFNTRGEVIGVTDSGFHGADSLGFAIPVHYVKDFLRNREAYAFDKDNPNTGIRYLSAPPKPRLAAHGGEIGGEKEAAPPEAAGKSGSVDPQGSPAQDVKKGSDS